MEPLDAEHPVRQGNLPNGDTPNVLVSDDP